MINLDCDNVEEEIPEVGDALVICTKKSKETKIMCKVKDVVICGDEVEVILQKSTNSFFNWNMYKAGNSWVSKVWNIGQVQMTTSSNSLKRFDDM